MPLTARWSDSGSLYICLNVEFIHAAQTNVDSLLGSGNDERQQENQREQAEPVPNLSFPKPTGQQIVTQNDPLSLQMFDQVLIRSHDFGKF